MTARRPDSIDRFMSGPPVVCACGREHRAVQREVLVGAGALDAVAELARRHADRDGPVALLADPDTWDAAGARVAADLRATGARVVEILAARAPHADDHTIDDLAPRVAAADPARVVAVGAGTINDLGKVLAARVNAPLMTVATAASMNGYTSAIAALTVAGLKVTRNAPPPDLLVVDSAVLAAAPARLARAGFGDLCSKPVSSADWVLSAGLCGEPLCPTALALVDGAVAAARARSAGIGANDAGAIEVLAEALVLSGLSMAFAGASSPASGGEHLVSHDLDISSESWGREPALHGEQVAVGTLASVALYARIAAQGRDLASRGPVPADESDDDVRALHAHLPPPALDAVRAEARAKAARTPDRAARRARLAADWDAVFTPVATQLAAATGLAGDLRTAGVPSTFASIGVDRARAAHVLKTARHIRDRYTVLDFAADLGALPAWADEIAAELAG